VQKHNKTSKINRCRTCVLFVAEQNEEIYKLAKLYFVEAGVHTHLVQQDLFYCSFSVIISTK